ncbi:hypothetical protein LTR10_024316 [Elasticomyces elasticus]|uniref:Uncharacterized protein n=1 Tax=Exophiala sideris TaxID=1016849 RepID=A0ABR0IVK2_9EURO|nr:hypothetical protein LTR10_024316 [Elasticomyces elasticus]KAK5020748.1 hypothetical protein LTS07_011456 [Exophiala sideris]KAK5022709.1 hypothetical protein LTR13_011425 [Exophiala sideris]KAK5048107.1 hypothetical protein LTR69_011458 [Exophiala sideris]KAK5175992.1 hypothetical protein LTR44_011451 [Eurotiomycetes sp. CCFEE 6388]
MDAVSDQDHMVCHAVRSLLAHAGRPKTACHRSCIDDICRDHPNWASYIEKLCVDVRIFLGAIASVPDVAAQSGDGCRESGLLASSGRPRNLVGGLSRGMELFTETIPQFSDEDIVAQQMEAGAVSEREWTTWSSCQQIPRSPSPLEPSGEGLARELVVPAGDRENMGGGNDADKSGEEQELDDVIHVGNDDDKIYHGMDDDNISGNKQVEAEQQENEEEGKRNRQDREELLTKTPKVPEGISVTSGITLKYVARPSRKRSTRAAILETPPKKSRLADPTATTPSQLAVRVTPESLTYQAYWKEWDMKREAEIPDNVQTSGTIKAVRVWDRFCERPRLVSMSSEYLQSVNPHRVNILVTMVLAVGNSHGFRALKRAMTAAQQGGTPSIADAFSNEPQRLVRTLTAIDTAGDTYAYMRRLALARLAKLYRNTAANAGQLAIDDDDAAWMSRRRPALKDDKAKAYRSMIEHIWGAAFPDLFRGQTMTKSGLIDSDIPEAVRWNQCKRKLSKQIEAGQRWLQWAERLGWSSLGLISRDWSIGDSRVVASDRTFEEMLSVSEHTMLLNAVDTEKGRFLRQVDRAVGGGLFELLADTNRVQRLPLLNLDDEEIMARSDCDPQWVVELTCQQPGA